MQQIAIALIFGTLLCTAIFDQAEAAGCIPLQTLRAEHPNTNSYVHEVKRSRNRVVSVYRQGDSFEDFVEVLREGRCILGIETISHDQLVSRYLEYPEAWIAEQEGLDNEGVPETGEEGEQDASSGTVDPIFDLNHQKVDAIFAGRIKGPDFKGREQAYSEQKDVILDDIKKGANFGGEFRIIEIGCGTSCSIAVIANLETGELETFPRGGEAQGPLTLKYAADSNLIVATWADRSVNGCMLQSTLRTGSGWVILAQTKIGSVDQCYEDIDQNIARFPTKVDGVAEQSQTVPTESADRKPVPAPSSANEVEKFRRGYELYMLRRRLQLQ